MKYSLTAVLIIVLVSPLLAQPNVPSPVNLYTYEQRLNTPLPSELLFKDEEGRDVRLGDYFKERPIIFVLVQYRCPMLCNQVLNGVIDCIRGIPRTAGKDFDVVVVSFDPRETPELALAKKKSYVEEYGRPGTENGWHFLTGKEDAIRDLTTAIGFRYSYSPPPIDRFAHPSGLVVLTPYGLTSKYFFGILFDQSEMTQALERASAGDIGKSVPAYMRVLMLCYDFDANSGKYVLTVMGAVRLGGVITVLAIGGSLFLSWWRESRSHRCAAANATTGGGA